jgi:hypothetical protein
VIEELALMLGLPVAAGGLEDRGAESMRSAEPGDRNHPTHRHPADGHPIQIKSMIREPEDDVVEFIDGLFDVIKDVFGTLAFVGPPFPMPREIDGTTPDSRPSESEISARVQFLARGPAMHPD